MLHRNTLITACSLALLFLFSTPLFAQWQRMPWPGFDTSLEFLRSTSSLIQTNGRLFACTQNGLYSSSDQGDTWQKSSGLPPEFKTISLQETDEGLFLYGSESPTGFPGSGFFNADKTGTGWVPAPQMPTSHSFFRLNNRYFAIFFNGSSTSCQYSDNQGASWEWLPDIPGTATISRLNWHHDTLYVVGPNDWRLYRSTDLGNTYQLLTPFRLRGVQTGDGWIAGQPLTGSNFLPTQVDSLVYSLDKGISWQKRKIPFVSQGTTVWLYKYGNSLYVQPQQNGYAPVYQFDFSTGSFNLFTSQGAPYNSKDQALRFGGVFGNCYIGLSQDTIYRVCNGIRTNLTNPGGGNELKEMITLGPSELLVLSTTGLNNHQAYLTQTVPGSPLALAPVEKTAYFTSSAYTWYSDTVYSAATSPENYIAKYHVPSQTKTQEKTFADGVVIDEVLRTNTHLAVRNYDRVLFRPIQGATWELFQVYNLKLVATPDYFYYLSNEDGKLYRRGASGLAEAIHVPGLVLGPNSNPLIAANDSVVMELIQDTNNPYRWKTLYFSTDYGATFQAVDMTPISLKNIYHSIRYLNGRIYVLTYGEGVYTYDLASDAWSPYNNGLEEFPNALVVYQGNLLATGANSGLYKRSTQPTYQLKGSVFLDENNNQVRDAGEQPVSNIGISTAVANGIYFTRPDGAFLSATDVAVDTHRVLLPSSYMQTQPPFVVTNNADQLVDFALQIPGNARDLSLSQAPNDVFRPGFETRISIQVQNLLLPASGVQLTVQLPAGDVSFVSSNPAPTANSGDTLLTWELGSLALFDNRSLQLTVKTDQATPLGKLLQLKGNVAANESDVLPSNNLSVLSATVVGSYDPNDKLVSRSRINLTGTPEKASLNYTIRFQNTGTFPTSFVTLLDSLPTPLLYPASLSLIGSSHACEVRLVEGNVLKIRFPDLALLPQQESESLSQGFVSFSITTSEPLSTPLVIRNRAGIYFDYNAPVITPYAETVVDFPVSSPVPATWDRLQIHPNPAHDLIWVEDAASEAETISVRWFDGLGKLVSTQALPPFQRTLSVPKGAASPLVLEIQTSQGVFQRPVIRI